jgi:MFS family permease
MPYSRSVEVPTFTLLELALERADRLVAELLGVLPPGAVLLVTADPVQIAILSSLAVVPEIFVGLFAGGFIDRHAKRPLLIWADIVRAVLGYTALALLVLLALGALFLFISEQGDIGTGSYTASQAMMFVLLSLPTFAGQLLPIGALIGALLALGNLARGSELVVMRASGITTARFCWWLSVAALILAVLMVSLSEFVAPPLEKYARQLKVFSKFNEFSFAGNRGTWVRDGDTIVSVEQQSSASRFGGVQLFRFDAKRMLVCFARGV